MFWQNEEFAQGLGKDIHLDGVVCVVDAVFGKKVSQNISLVHPKSNFVNALIGVANGRRPRL